MTGPAHPVLRALPTVAVEVLESLHQHRVLTARQIHALHTPNASLRWAQRILTRLHKRGLTEHAAGPHGLALWFLTAPGAETIQAAGTLAEPRRRLTTPAQAAGPLRAHTLAVNDTGIAFVQAAREHAGDSCGSLRGGMRSRTPTPPGVRGRHGAHACCIADALLSYLQAAPDDSLILHQRFIELDRGTIPPTNSPPSSPATPSFATTPPPKTPRRGRYGGPTTARFPRCSLCSPTKHQRRRDGACRRRSRCTAPTPHKPATGPYPSPSRRSQS